MVHSANNVLIEYDVTADGKRFPIDTAGGTGAAAAPPNADTIRVSELEGAKK